MLEIRRNDLSKALDAKLVIEPVQDTMTDKAQRAIEQANKVWDEKGWTDTNVDRMLNTKMRSSQISRA